MNRDVSPKAPETAAEVPLSGDIRAAARRVVALADPTEKAHASRAAAAAWGAGTLTFSAREPADLPPCLDRPGRLARPDLLDPARMPKRRLTGVKGRVALLHALAHIELNAVNLAWDMVGRFATAVEESAFVADWVGVGDDEARHFLMLATRLEELDASYGDNPAHDGLWDAAYDTRWDVLARLAVVPLVLEARGLDVCPDMINRLSGVNDLESAAILRVIYEDEIRHVRVGMRWLERVCVARGAEVRRTWQALVKSHFRGQLKPPFNDTARAQAGFPRDFYAPLAAVPPKS